MLGTGLIILLMSFFIHLGQFLALESHFIQLSMFEKVTILLFIPIILANWQTALVNFYVAMTLALAEKLMEKIENVPEKNIDIWIKDCLTLFNAFEKKISFFLFFFMSSL